MELTRREALRLGTSGAAFWIASRSDQRASGATRKRGDSQPREGDAPLSRVIASSGTRIPVIGLGTWQTFDVGASAAERAPLVDVLRGFVEMGGTLIDSSPMYGRSEDVVGEETSKLGLRSRLFVATKVWTRGRTAGIEQMEASMRKLRADPIDLMQVHNLLDVETHLATLADWKRAGRVRHVGITHYTAASQPEVERVMQRHPIDVIQINYSVGEREAEARLLPAALERGVGVIANRPFAGGGLFRRVLRQPLPDWAAEIDCTSWAQLLLKFVVSHPAILCAIPATSNAAHLRDNMKAAYGRLPDAALRARIAAAAA